MIFPPIYKKGVENMPKQDDDCIKNDTKNTEHAKILEVILPTRFYGKLSHFILDKYQMLYPKTVIIIHNYNENIYDDSNDESSID